MIVLRRYIAAAARSARAWLRGTAPDRGSGQCDLCGNAPAEADGRCVDHFRIM